MGAESATKAELLSFRRVGGRGPDTKTKATGHNESISLEERKRKSGEKLPRRLLVKEGQGGRAY